ncbi:FAD-dependent oxidoreductase [Oscillatoria sp. CS-180]|uniref:NAD(P)/FAD-dependent oxidoreductase n=1 Tax=Oscillatoria sp. CS-180 TaxID=3021720 RepID=UPI00232C2EDE|nr:FAD-dependent oxidoreductase [Oscillatoria sp. CS-180]MDB9529015.1 FAD-dependent oxidoreductase [Oscillatoria sp. CS-180]
MALQDVVVVGAGMAGLICARRLQQAGYQVCVLEKSRGLGGRLATRRINGVPLDHGARYIQPEGEWLNALTQQLIAQGVLTLWQPHCYALDPSGHLQSAKLTLPYYVASQGMSAVGKAIAANLAVHRQQRVTALLPTPDNTWHITAERVADGTSVQHRAKAIVLAIPAPQIVPLLEPLRSHASLAKAATAISTVQYAPCLTVMAQYEPPFAFVAAPLPCDPTEPWAIEGHPDTPFFWIGLDSSKRSVEGFNVVLHSSSNFAQTWLDADNLQPAGSALLAEAGQFIASWMMRPLRWQVHRWRYARVKVPCPDSLPTMSDPLPLVACGDWCGDRHINSAFESGWAAADAVNTLLNGSPLANFSLD